MDPLNPSLNYPNKLPCIRGSRLPCIKLQELYCIEQAVHSTITIERKPTACPPPQEPGQAPGPITAEKCPPPLSRPPRTPREWTAGQERSSSTESPKIEKLENEEFPGGIENHLPEDENRGQPDEGAAGGREQGTESHATPPADPGNNDSVLKDA